MKSDLERNYAIGLTGRGGGVKTRLRTVQFLIFLFYCSLAALRSLNIQTRGCKKWILTRSYPAEFEKNQCWVAKGRAGLP